MVDDPALGFYTLAGIVSVFAIVAILFFIARYQRRRL